MCKHRYGVLDTKVGQAGLALIIALLPIFPIISAIIANEYFHGLLDS